MNPLPHALPVLLGMLFLPGYPTAAAQVAARLSPEATEIWVGRPFDVILQVACPDGTVVRVLPPATGPRGPELVSRQAWDTLSAADGRLSLSLSLQYIAWDTGRTEIPPLAVLAGTDTIHTDALRLSAAFPSVDTTLADIKPIVAEPARWDDFLPYLAGIAGLGAVILATLYLRRRSRRSRPAAEPLPPPLPPHAQALRRLEELRQKQWWQTGRIREYHSELTHIVRSYIEQRFDIPALEQTTPEILARWLREGQDPSLAGKLRSLLETADLVKFAQAEPPADFHERAMLYVREFISETKPAEPNEAGTTPQSDV